MVQIQIIKSGQQLLKEATDLFFSIYKMDLKDPMSSISMRIWLKHIIMIFFMHM
jgi:hypothetical protein